MNTYNDIQLYIASVIGAVSILLCLFWLFIIAHRLHLTLKKYKKYLNQYVYSHMRSEILKTLKILRNRDIFLIILLSLDLFIIIALTLVLPQMNVQVYHSNSTQITIKGVFTNCTTISDLFDYSYIFPANSLLFISFDMLIVTEYMLISFLNSYLSIQYLGNSLPKKVIYKYIICWVLQYCFQLIFIIPQLQYFIPSVITFIFFINWLNIVVTSRKMCSAIRSKMQEIRLFEWNPGNYRQLSTSLKHYKFAMFFFISGFWLSVVAMACVSFSFFLDLLTTKCYLKEVYGINFHFNLTTLTFQSYLDILDFIAFIFASVYGVFFLIPSLFLFIVYVANFLYNYCTGKGNMMKLQNELLVPLILDE